MIVTRYPQACLLVECDSTRLLVDPGIPATSAYTRQDFGSIDAVLITHEHGDHFDPEFVTALATDGVAVIADPSVAARIPAARPVVLDSGESHDIDTVAVQAHDLPHCPMVDGSPGPSNTGFVIDGSLLHPGDSVTASVQARWVATPLAGPDISMRDAYDFTIGTGAVAAIPIHYDIFPADPHRFVRACPSLQVHVLEEGASIELG